MQWWINLTVLIISVLVAVFFECIFFKTVNTSKNTNFQVSCDVNQQTKNKSKNKHTLKIINLLCIESQSHRPCASLHSHSLHSHSLHSHSLHSHSLHSHSLHSHSLHSQSLHSLPSTARVAEVAWCGVQEGRLSLLFYLHVIQRKSNK